MRYLLTAIACILTLSLWAQDGINYQGAATDANGDELTNQNITLRASVLSASANGNLEWEETHSTTTDQFGLFNVVIGQGTNTTNGATANFDEMDWGSANHFLKIEMDATGGDNYAMIGTTQMMSVPYALYAKSAGIDSTMIADMIAAAGGFGSGGGCDFNWPTGINGQPIIHSLLDDGDYIVPTGKNLFITHSVFRQHNATITVNGLKIIKPLESPSFPKNKPLIVNEGDVVSYVDDSGTPEFVNFYGILMDVNPQINSIVYDITNNNYVVPDGKNLVITHSLYESNSVFLSVNGYEIALPSESPSFPTLNPIYTKPGDIISYYSTGSPNSQTYVHFSGYLVDEDYFADCGGGGSSEGGLFNNIGFGEKSFLDWNELKWEMDTWEIAVFNPESDGFLQIGECIGDEPFVINVIPEELDPCNGIYENCEFSSTPFWYGFDMENYQYNSSNDVTIPVLESELVFIGDGGGGTCSPDLVPIRWTPLETQINEGGGGSSDGGSGGVSVSSFGDTLTINGESVIVPGVSFLNVAPEFGSVTDASGNAYSTVDYGPAGEWMTENLKTENFANGDQIPMITSSYSSSNHPASWAWIDNNYLNEAVYGKSYNGNAITDSRNVCPSGWHIPSENEWIQLILLFGGETGTDGCNNCFGGDNLKSDIFWNGNNQSYMSIVPGGIVNTDGSGAYDGSSGYYWVNDYVGGNGGYAMHFKSDNEITESSWMYYTFLTVRCIKD